MHYEQERLEASEARWLAKQVRWREANQRRSMSRAERRREAAEGRLRVLRAGTSPLYAAVARAVRLGVR